MSIERSVAAASHRSADLLRFSPTSDLSLLAKSPNTLCSFFSSLLLQQNNLYLGTCHTCYTFAGSVVCAISGVGLTKHPSIARRVLPSPSLIYFTYESGPASCKTEPHMVVAQAVSTVTLSGQHVLRTPYLPNCQRDWSPLMKRSQQYVTTVR